MCGCCSPTGWLPIARAAKPSLDLLIRWCHESGPVCLHWPWCLSKLISGKNQSACAVGAGSHSLLQGVHLCLWSHLRKSTGLCKGDLQLVWELCPHVRYLLELLTSGNSSVLPSARRRRETVPGLNVPGWNGTPGGMELEAALAELSRVSQPWPCPAGPCLDLNNCLAKAQGVKSSVGGSLGLQAGAGLWPPALLCLAFLSGFSQPWGQRPERQSSSSAHCRYFWTLMLYVNSLSALINEKVDFCARLSSTSLIRSFFCIFSLQLFYFQEVKAGIRNYKKNFFELLKCRLLKLCS